MKINTIYIRNFKGFKEEEFSFDPNMSVLIGDDGSGKSSVLDVLSFVLRTTLVLRASAHPIWLIFLVPASRNTECVQTG